jgi:hypothetical protein
MIIELEIDSGEEWVNIKHKYSCPKFLNIAGFGERPES